MRFPLAPFRVTQQPLRHIDSKPFWFLIDKDLDSTAGRLSSEEVFTKACCDSLQNLFETITLVDPNILYIWNNLDVVADNPTDILTLVAGDGITIELDSLHDAVKISAIPDVDEGCHWERNDSDEYLYPLLPQDFVKIPTWLFVGNTDLGMGVSSVIHIQDTVGEVSRNGLNIYLDIIPHDFARGFSAIDSLIKVESPITYELSYLIGLRSDLYNDTGNYVWSTIGIDNSIHTVGDTAGIYSINLETSIGGGVTAVLYGVRISAPDISGTGVIEDLYGLYIGRHDFGTYSSWSLFSDGGDSYFKDRVGIGLVGILSNQEILSYLDVEGSVGHSIITTTSNLSLTVYHHTILADASTQNINITLPNATTCDRRVYVVKAIDVTNSVRVKSAGGNIDQYPAATGILYTTQYESHSFHSDGVQWWQTISAVATFDADYFKYITVNPLLLAFDWHAGLGQVIAAHADDTLYLYAGAGIEIEYDDQMAGIKITSTIDPSGLSDSWRTISTVLDTGFTWDDTTVVSSAYDDTLYLIAGNGIGVSMDTALDAIKIESLVMAYKTIAINPIDVSPSYADVATHAHYYNDQLNLFAGTGIGLSVDANTDSIKIDCTVTDTNTTYTHALVDSGNDVILRLVSSVPVNDDVTFIAGTNITITVDEPNQTATISSTGGGGSSLWEHITNNQNFIQPIDTSRVVYGHRFCAGTQVDDTPWDNVISVVETVRNDLLYGKGLYVSVTGNTLTEILYGGQLSASVSTDTNPTTVVGAYLSGVSNANHDLYGAIITAQSSAVTTPTSANEFIGAKIQIEDYSMVDLDFVAGLKVEGLFKNHDASADDIFLSHYTASIGNVTNTVTGILNRLYYLYVAPLVKGSNSTVQELYGLYVSSLTDGIDHNYAIYTGLGDIRFGGITESAGTVTGWLVIEDTGLVKWHDEPVGGNGNSFETISIVADSGFTWDDTTIVADSATDTLSLIAGTNITLTMDAALDAIRISASGGVSTHTLLDLDVHTDSVDGSVTKGDIVFANGTPKWDRLPRGTTSQVLRLASDLPSWSNEDTDISFIFKDITRGVSQVYILDINATYAYDITDIIIEVDTGTLTGILFKVDSTTIATLTGDTSASVEVVGSGNVAAGQRVTMTTAVTYTGLPTQISGKLRTVRI